MKYDIIEIQSSMLHENPTVFLICLPSHQAKASQKFNLKQDLSYNIFIFFSQISKRKTFPFVFGCKTFCSNAILIEILNPVICSLTFSIIRTPQNVKGGTEALYLVNHHYPNIIFHFFPLTLFSHGMCDIQVTFTLFIPLYQLRISYTTMINFVFERKILGGHLNSTRSILVCKFSFAKVKEKRQKYTKV